MAFIVALPHFSAVLILDLPNLPHLFGAQEDLEFLAPLVVKSLDR